jgi:PAS domain S-box-containing protein
MQDNLSSRQFPKVPVNQQYLTELEQAKESLRQSEEQSQLMIESATDFAIFRISPDGSIASWNIGAERVFGFKESEIIGRSFDILFTPEDREKQIPQKELETALKEGRAVNERWHLRKDGRCFFASGMIYPLKGERGGGTLKSPAIKPTSSPPKKRSAISRYCKNSFIRRKTNESALPATCTTKSVSR